MIEVNETLFIVIVIFSVIGALAFILGAVWFYATIYNYDSYNTKLEMDTIIKNIKELRKDNNYLITENRKLKESLKNEN